MTLRISALLALIASFSAAYAAPLIDRLYAELLKGSPLPKLTDAVLWQGGLWYWAFIPGTIALLYVAGERAKKESTRQRFAEIIMSAGVISTSVFIVGSTLPLTNITFSLQ